jgi:predicted DNA-binding transcriptional regulator AlpA
MPQTSESLKAVFQELRKLRQDLARPAPRLLTVDQTACYLGLSEKTLRNRLGPRAKKPFPVKPLRIGGKILFQIADLDSFIDRLAASQK